MARIRSPRGPWGFPNPVNEKAARTVAAVVLCLGLLALVTHWIVLLAVLAYGFWARVLTGPKLSPVGWAAQNLIAPRLGARRPVPGPPKRFAQGIGAAFTTTALVLGLCGAWTAADVMLGLLCVAAGLESIAGLCLGCHAFALLMRLGVVPDTVCEECADITRRWGASARSSG